MNPRQPQQKEVVINGARLSYFEWGAPREGQPTLYFVHATGFHGRVWDWHVNAFPDHHVISLEQRGHGRSESLSVRHWQQFGQDQARFVETLNLQQLIGIGHSMGAHGLVDGAALSGRFQSLLLLDPVIAAPEAYADADNFSLPGIELNDETLHPAAKRRRYFSSVEEMLAQIGKKSAFPLFEPQILRDYCEYGLLPTDSDSVADYELACHPEVEAWVYMTSRTNGDVYKSVRGLDIPVVVMRAKAPNPEHPGDFSSSPTWPGLAAEFKQGREIYLPECTHFIPMQEPARVIGEIETLIATWKAQANH